MERLVIQGGRPLRGTVRISGAKNGALPLIAATLLSEGRCVLRNVPDLKDIRTLAEILREVGLSVEKSAPNTFVTQLVSEENSVARYELVSQMRASIYLLGPLLAKRGYAKVSLPGGCVIGLRPVDLHVKGMRALGAEIELEHGYIVAKAPGGRLKGAHMHLSGPNGSSVGATANVLMASVLAEGETVIDGAACEPEIAELCEFLNAMGSRISGIGTPRLVIEGVKVLHGARFSVPSDRIEAGTYMAAAAITGGDVLVEEAPMHHLGAVVAKLREAGVEITEQENGLVRVRRTGPIQPVNMTTQVYPGYPTDVQAQLVSLLTLAEGTSVVSEKIYPDRFMHCAELNRMGADIQKESASALIRGVPQLSGADVMASDLRAGAALVMAGLAAQGETTVHRIYHIDRGYEHIEKKLTALGANISRQELTPSTTLKRAA